MPFTARVGSADEVLTSLFVDFQIVGDVFAVRPMTKNQSIRWMVKAKVFHEILRRLEFVKIGRSKCESLERRPSFDARGKLAVLYLYGN
jgi:hypothetical protein